MLKILDFPMVRQSTAHTCSCACLQACLCYYGIEKREGQIARLMNVKASHSEIHPNKIVRVARFLDLKAEYLKMSLKDIRKYINKGIPIVVGFQAWAKAKNPDYSYGNDNNGHYAVIIGYDKQNIIFFDPASFYKTFLSYEEFELRWHDGNTADADYDRMGIIIYGPKPVYNSSIIKKIE